MNDNKDYAFWSWIAWLDSDHIADSTFTTMLYHESLGGIRVPPRWKRWIEG